MHSYSRITMVVLVITTIIQNPSAQVVRGGDTVTIGPSGEKFTFKSQTLVFPESGRVSEAKFKGTGQFFYGKKSLLLTSGKILTITNDTLIVVTEEKRWPFSIGEQTKFCDENKKLVWNNIHQGDTVTVISDTSDLHAALSIREGTLVIAGMHRGASEPVDYKCK